MLKSSISIQPYMGTGRGNIISVFLFSKKTNQISNISIPQYINIDNNMTIKARANSSLNQTIYNPTFSQHSNIRNSRIYPSGLYNLNGLSSLFHKPIWPQKEFLITNFFVFTFNA